MVVAVLGGCSGGVGAGGLREAGRTVIEDACQHVIHRRDLEARAFFFFFLNLEIINFAHRFCHGEGGSVSRVAKLEVTGVCFSMELGVLVLLGNGVHATPPQLRRSAGKNINIVGSFIP